MFSTTIIGIDGSPGGADGLALARRLSAPGAALIAVSVAVVDAHPSRAASRDYDVQAMSDAGDVIDTLAADGGALTGEVVRASSVAAGLTAAAARHHADLVVLGSCRRGVVGRVLAGDDTRETLRLAERAVAVAPRDYRLHDGAIARIGVGWDGSASDQALAVARALAADLGAQVQPLTVVGVPAWPTPGGTEVGELVAARRRGAPAPGAETTVLDARTLPGYPAQALEQFAREVDLLVVGSRHLSAVQRFVFGSASESLGRRVTHPLLVVPQRAAAGAGAVR